MTAELRQVADGFAYRVMSFSSYDVNGYRFHTTSHEKKRPNRRTTNTGVFTPGLDGVEYYGRIEEIYQLKFEGCKPLSPVVFKCHWFDPEATRRYPNLGLVEIRQSSVLPGDDVYIVAQQATQVYYLSYPCQKDDRLKGWDVVYKVSLICIKIHFYSYKQHTPFCFVHIDKKASTPPTFYCLTWDGISLDIFLVPCYAIVVRTLFQIYTKQKNENF